MGIDFLLGNFFEGDSLPISVADGFIGGFITAYYGDVIANVILDNNSSLTDIFKVRSDFAGYFASTFASGVTGVTALYLDADLNNVVGTILFFVFIYLGEYYFSGTEEDTARTAHDIVFDAVCVSILLFVFGSNARKSYFDRIPSVDTDTDFLAFIIINVYYALRSENTNDV